MFEFIISLMQAYTQVGMFIAALVCLGIGGLITGNCLYWRVHAQRVEGKIIGVIPNGNSYAPIYRYRGIDGQSREAKSDMSSGWIRGKETGRSVQLMIAPHNPSEAREVHSYVLDIVGLFFLVPGLLLAYTALAAYPITPLTWIMALAFLGYAGERIYSLIIPKAQRLSLAEWRKQRGLDGHAVLDLSAMKPIETLVAENPQTPQANRKIAIPVLGLFAVLLIGFGAYQGVKTFRLETLGVRAEGKIMRLVEQTNSDGDSSYYPVVRFQAADGRRIEFKSSIGSNHPTLRPGDRVTVLYLTADPRQSIIDHGPVINWALPGLVLLGAAFVSWVLTAMLRSKPMPNPATQ